MRRSHQRRSKSTSILDGLLPLSDFFSHSLVRGLRELRMGPGVICNFVPFCERPPRNFGIRNDVGTYNEERRFDVALLQKR